MLGVLFPFSYFGICLGFLIGVGITVACFGFLSAGIVSLCIFFGMIRIMPLVNMFKKCINILAPNQLEKIKENIGESFKLKKTNLEEKTYIYMWHPHGVFPSSIYFHTQTQITNWPSRTLTDNRIRTNKQIKKLCKTSRGDTYQSNNLIRNLFAMFIN
jgi:hypothetical protein